MPMLVAAWAGWGLVLVEKVMDNVDQLLAVVRLGNRVAKKQARRILGARKLAVLHEVLKDPAQAARYLLTVEQVGEIAAIPPEQKALIEATWEAARVLWQQYKRMVFKVMRRLALRLGISDEHNLADLEGESAVGFLKAVRGYSKGRFQFTTYFCCCVRTELRRYLKRSRGLSGANEKLLIAYRAVWERLATGGKACTFRDCVREMGLNEAGVRRLWGTLQEPISEQDCEENLARVVQDRGSPGLDYDLIQAIRMVEMTALERDAFQAQECLRGIFPEAHKSLKAVAAAHGVSPQAANFAVERARERLEQALRGKV